VRPAVALTALALVLCVVSSAAATPPGRNGRIAYMLKDSHGHWQVWVAGATLTRARQLTRGASDSGWPSWSPDGKQIVFDSARTDRTPDDARHVNDVFVMNADGSGVRRLTDSRGRSGDASWSPNGSSIAFDADRGKPSGLSAIYVMNAAGGPPRKIVAPPKGMSDYKPRFSPDGTHVVFLRARGAADGAPAALFTVRLDGSGLHRLTPFSLRADDADWSPDGRRIVFDAYPNPAAYGDIYAVGSGGGRAVDLTRNPVRQAGPRTRSGPPTGTRSSVSTIGS
jgi:TolB protein